MLPLRGLVRWSQLACRSDSMPHESGCQTRGLRVVHFRRSMCHAIESGPLRAVHVSHPQWTDWGVSYERGTGPMVVLGGGGLFFCERGTPAYGPLIVSVGRGPGPWRLTNGGVSSMRIARRSRLIVFTSCIGSSFSGDEAHLGRAGVTLHTHVHLKYYGPLTVSVGRGLELSRRTNGGASSRRIARRIRRRRRLACRPPHRKTLTSTGRRRWRELKTRDFFFFFFIALGLEMSDTKVYEP